MPARGRVSAAPSESEADYPLPPPREIPPERTPKPKRDAREKRRSSRRDPDSVPWLKLLLAALFLCGPIGTVISFWLLPKEEEVDALASLHAMPPSSIGGGATPPGLVRMVHLSLAGTERRARFVLDDRTAWDAFIAGCKERLQVEHITRVTDSGGEAIFAVEDLVHDDHIVIHADDANSIGGAALLHQQDLAPGVLPPDDLAPSPPPGAGAASAAAAVVGAAVLIGKGPRSLQSVDLKGGANRTRPMGELLQDLDALQAQAAAAHQTLTLPKDTSPPLPMGDASDWYAKQHRGADDALLPGYHPRGAAAEKLEVAAAGGAATHAHAAAGANGESFDVDELLEGGAYLLDADHPGKPCTGAKHPSFRIAMLIPWVNELPPWLTYFIATAQRSAYLVRRPPRARPRGARRAARPPRRPPAPAALAPTLTPAALTSLHHRSTGSSSTRRSAPTSCRARCPTTSNSSSSARAACRSSWV
jgi:hypothetical protein